MHTKRFDTFLKRWVQFRVVAIPHLSLASPHLGHFKCKLFIHFEVWLKMKSYKQRELFLFQLHYSLSNGLYFL
jgi:hypothetical protein